MEKVIFKDLIKKMKEKWHPQDVAFINETALRLAKVEGPYDWHTHPGEDEFFMVLEGQMFIDMQSPDRTIELNPMEGFLVKRGTKHRSRTEHPAWIVLVEPTRTNTLGIKQ